MTTRSEPRYKPLEVVETISGEYHAAEWVVTRYRPSYGEDYWLVKWAGRMLPTSYPNKYKAFAALHSVYGEER